MNDVSKYLRPATLPKIPDSKKRAGIYPLWSHRFVSVPEWWIPLAICAGNQKSYGVFPVGLLLWQQYRLNHGKQPLKLTRRMRERFGLKRRLMDSGLNALERAGLITVQRFRHRSPLITIVTRSRGLEHGQQPHQKAAGRA
jgi:hypothetical protein